MSRALRPTKFDGPDATHVWDGLTWVEVIATDPEEPQSLEEAPETQRLVNERQPHVRTDAILREVIFGVSPEFPNGVRRHKSFSKGRVASQRRSEMAGPSTARRQRQQRQQRLETDAAMMSDLAKWRREQQEFAPASQAALRDLAVSLVSRCVRSQLCCAVVCSPVVLLVLCCDAL